MSDYNPDDDHQLDRGIAPYVEVLRKAGVETFESCSGGSGHTFPEPTICFYGEKGEGYRALSVALQHGLPLAELRRSWRIIEGEPTGPNWELVFRHASS